MIEQITKIYKEHRERVGIDDASIINNLLNYGYTTKEANVLLNLILDESLSQYLKMESLIHLAKSIDRDVGFLIEQV